MPIETACRFQKALYWAKSTYDNYGQPVLEETAAELDVRWENVNKDVLDSQGNTISADAVVVVDRDIEVGSVMWLGCLADVEGTSLIPESQLREVVSFSSVPDIKGRYYRRVAYLKRLHDTLPLES